MRNKPRHAIKQVDGPLFYTDNEVTERRWSPDPADPTRNVARLMLKPVFLSAHPDHAVKYDTVEDAESHMKHPDLDDPSAFQNCNVVEVD